MLNVLVVRGDGRFIRWISLPRGVAKLLLVVAVIGSIANVAALVHYASLYRHHATLVATNGILEENARVLAPLRRRLAEVREEMGTWDSLHAAVLKPLGGQPRGAAGVGGPALAIPKGGKTLDEIDVLLAHVREESRRLRTLGQMAREAGGVLAALPQRLPLRSGINSGYGPRLSPWTGRPEFHAGIDLAAGPGTPVQATQGGVVRFAGTAVGYGESVVIDHGAGIESRYGHLQKVAVSRGQRVERGQLIGLSGNTGRSTAPHLHYEVLVDGRPIDPRRVTREN
ncbi:MAG: M23 family metallopeptidase [Candidatus Rokubacteria bacterium]|nr:M23 family metallopeptidase [Candidatus Rokubacteria bacterium]